MSRQATKMRKRKRQQVMQDSLTKLAPGLVLDCAGIISAKKALDAYTNIPANLGMGANNLSQTGRYVMERFTWDYMTLNTLFRNNWIAKAIIEKPANEMMKNGFIIQSQIDPDKIQDIMNTWRRTRTEARFLKCIKWARLYGGCLLIPLIEGQEDMSEPLDLDSIMPGDYKGCMTIDRWSGVSPSVELVTDISDPHFGTPAYYDVSDDTSGKTVRMHHSRVIKMIGRELPYWEEIAESYWGASELEHVYTELKKRDDTSANIAFLIFLANIRVHKMDGLAQMLTMGDQEAAQHVYDTMVAMNHLMCNTGTVAMDKEDSFEMHQYSFTGINDVYESFMLDISGAAEIPVDKLFGRSPSGFNSGDETLQNYYDTIQEKQETYVREPLEQLIKIITMSTLGEIPDDMEIEFNPVRRPSDLEKSDLASKMAEPVFTAVGTGLIGKASALRELKQQSPLVGLWSNITDEMINEAEKEDKENKEQDKLDEQQMKEYVKNMTGGNNSATEETPFDKTRQKPEENKPGN